MTIIERLRIKKVLKRLFVARQNHLCTVWFSVNVVKTCTGHANSSQRQTRQNGFSNKKQVHSTILFGLKKFIDIVRYIY